jgi:hypothetical protein
MLCCVSLAYAPFGVLTDSALYGLLQREWKAA